MAGRAKELRWNFSLKKGQMVTGKVIDADTKQPIAGAEVVGRGSVLTDKDGKFALPVLPGYSFAVRRRTHG